MNHIANVNFGFNPMVQPVFQQQLQAAVSGKCARAGAGPDCARCCFARDNGNC